MKLQKLEEAVSGSSKKTANTCSAERMWPLRWGTAVSYTHLDVYKRQLERKYVLSRLPIHRGLKP